MQGSSEQQHMKTNKLMSEKVMQPERLEYCSHANVRAWLAATDFDDEPASPKAQPASCSTVFVNALSSLRLRKSSAGSRASQWLGTSITSSVASSASAQHSYTFGTTRFV